MKIKELLQCPYGPVRVVVAHLNTLPDDEVLTNEELTEQVGIRPDGGTFGKMSKQYAREYQHTVRINGKVRKVWGNKRAIAALREKLNENKPDQNRR